MQSKVKRSCQKAAGLFALLLYFRSGHGIGIGHCKGILQDMASGRKEDIVVYICSWYTSRVAVLSIRPAARMSS